MPIRHEGREGVRRSEKKRMSAVIWKEEEDATSDLDFFTIFYHLYSRFFASIRGSKTLSGTALRGRIGLPAKETRLHEARFKRRNGSSCARTFCTKVSAYFRSPIPPQSGFRQSACGRAGTGPGAKYSFFPRCVEIRHRTLGGGSWVVGGGGG